MNRLRNENISWFGNCKQNRWSAAHEGGSSGTQTARVLSGPDVIFCMAAYNMNYVVPPVGVYFKTTTVLLQLNILMSDYKDGNFY